MKPVVSVIALLATAALADVELTRNVDSLGDGVSIKAVLDSGCTGSDAYGSNNCALAWGSSTNATITGTLPKDLTAKSQLSLDLKVSLVPLKATCAICGSDCELTVPIVKIPVSIKLPPCPIKGGPLNAVKTITLGAKSPVPIKLNLSGKATLNDDDGAEVVTLDVSGSVGP